MLIVCITVTIACLALLLFTQFNSKRLERRVQESDTEIDRLRQHYETEARRIQAEANASLSNAQVLLDQQLAEMNQELDRLRQHYQAQARQAEADAQDLVKKTRDELEPLRKYESLQQPEIETARLLSEAVQECEALRKDAQALLGSAQVVAEQERSQAKQKAKELRQRGEAILTQATRDAGRIVSDAEKRAEQIGGEAYSALRDKQTLEQAVQALWNTTEGYGDRYVVPSRSLLDELAADFGHTEAGEASVLGWEATRDRKEEGVVRDGEGLKRARAWPGGERGQHAGLGAGLGEVVEFIESRASGGRAGCRHIGHGDVVEGGADEAEEIARHLRQRSGGVLGEIVDL